jgi:transposase
MEEVSIIGLDLAKRVFQVHGNDARGRVCYSKKLSRVQLLGFFSRHPRCVVAMEACASSHYWGREIGALGHEVRLIPAQYVKPFVKRGKNDAADAEAICEAAVRPNMRFVGVKSGEQHGQAMLFRARDLLVHQRTALINAIRGHFGEFGVIGRQGQAGFEEIKKVFEEGALPATALLPMRTLFEEVASLDEKIERLEKEMNAVSKADPQIKALRTIPGVGPITALAVRSLGADPKTFASGRDYAAWMGLVPRQNSSGGKEKLGRVTKKGNKTLRRLVMICAGSLVNAIARGQLDGEPWIQKLMKAKPRMVVITAVANKIARVLWALQVHGGVYKARTAA